MSVRDLIDAIASGDSIATQQAFEQEMMSRVAARIDDKRVEVAQNMFSSEEAIAEEAIAEDAEQLDELSGATLGSFIQKRHADNMARRAHAKELDADPKVQKLSAKVTDYVNRREYTASGASKHRSKIDAAQRKIYDRKKELDPQYPQSTFLKTRGVEKALNRLANNRKLTEADLSALTLEELDDLIEHADQLDELSKSTLASYAKKAAKDAKGTGFNAGKLLGQAMTGPEVGSALNVDAKAHKRLSNVNKAIDRMAKEDVELEEQADTIHPNHIHVERVEGNKYKVHRVGKNWADGVNPGEHLNDTHLDDLSEMGARIKLIKPAK